MALITVKEEFCKGCGYCIEYCPTEVYAQSKRMNKKGYLIPEVVDLEKCTECGLCDMYCPDFAIILVKEGKKETKK